MTNVKHTATTIRLRDVAVKIGSGITPDGGRKSYVRHGVPLIRSQNVNNDRLLLDKVAHITEEQDAAMANTRLQAGDVLLNITGASIGRSCVVPHDFRRGNVNQHVCIIRCNGQINPAFLQAYLASHRGQHQIMQLQAGGGRQGINFKEIGNIRLPNLDREKQDEVVDVLATTDRAIAGVEKLIAAKRVLKKGLAQQLLTGQRRLPGFSKPWGKRRIDTISRIAKGAGITKEDIQPHGLPAVRYGELYTTYDVQITEARSFVSPEAAQAAKPIRCGDLLLAGSGEDRIEIGKAAAYMGDGVAYAGGDVIIVSPTDANSVFLAYLLDGEYARREFYRRAQGESIVHIYMRDVGSLELTLPPREEQDRIAAVLSAADREIVLLEKKLAALRELKKGLMQKLLSGPVKVKA